VLEVTPNQCRVLAERRHAEFGCYPLRRL